MTLAPDKASLLSRRARVRISNPVNGSAWEGRVISYADFPTIEIELDDGRRMSLPQSFTIEEAVPQPEHEEAREWLARAARAAERGITAGMPSGLVLLVTEWGARRSIPRCSVSYPYGPVDPPEVTWYALLADGTEITIPQKELEQQP